MNANLLNYACAASFLAASWMANATPLRRADIAGDPAWVAHIDCDRLRQSAIGEHILSEMEKPQAQARLATFQSTFGLDLRTQLHGLTVYSIGTASTEGVLVVYADFDAAKLVTLAQAAKDSQSTTYKQHTIYNWIDDSRKGHDGAERRVYAAIQGNRVVFGQREATVSKALDVLDGTASNLSAGKAFPELGASGDSNFLEAAARKLDLPDSNPNAAVFRLSKLMRLQIGETKRQLTASLTLDADSEEVANNMMSIVQGLVGLLKVQKEKPETVQLAEALAIKQDGARVVVKLSLPANDAVQMIKAGEARKATKKARKD